MFNKSKISLPKLALYLGIGGIIFLAGTVVGANSVRKKTITAGTVNIDHSEEDEPERLFLELETSLDNLVKSEYATFRVTRRNYISSK